MAEIKCPHCGTEHVHKCGKLPSGKQRYLCNECKKRFSTGNAVVKQALDEHCPYCGGELRYRGYNNSGSRRYRCKECGRSCSGTTLLKPRQVNKEGVKCPYCGSLHVKKGGRLKSGAKRYVCNDCSKGFSENTVVREQVKIVCPDCGGACTRSGHNEEGEQRYKCKSCGKKFLENPQKRYETHEKTCPRCEHKFAKKADKTNGKQYYRCLNCNHKFLEDPQYKQITAEQKQKVVMLIEQGLSRTQIAKQLHCVTKTITNIAKNMNGNLLKMLRLNGIQQIQIARQKQHKQALERKAQKQLQQQQKQQQRLDEKQAKIQRMIELMNLGYTPVQISEKVKYSVKTVKLFLCDFDPLYKDILKNNVIQQQQEQALQRALEKQRQAKIKQQQQLRAKLELQEQQKQQVINLYTQTHITKHDIAKQLNISYNFVCNVTKNVASKKQLDKKRKILLEKHIKKCVLNGANPELICKTYNYTRQQLQALMQDAYKQETITKEQTDLIIKFGVQLHVPVEYLAQYVPCSYRKCKQIMKQYNHLKTPKKKIVLTELEIAQDKFELDRFIR